MKVMVFGSFDTLHDGHRNLFSQAKKLGEVVVVVARDSTIRLLKRREPRMVEEERVKVVAKEPLVTQALLGSSNDLFAVVEQERPDILLLGYDQTTFSEEEILVALKDRGVSPRILRAKAYKPEEFKSSKLV